MKKIVKGPPHVPAALDEVSVTPGYRSRALSPSHYAQMSPEPIDVIEAWELDFHTASALSYIARAGRKDGESREADLLKAANYLYRAATGHWLPTDRS